MSDSAPTLEPIPGVGFRTRFRYGKGLRARFIIRLLDEDAARDRALALQGLANLLARSGHSADAPTVLRKAAAVQSESDFAASVKVTE